MSAPKPDSLKNQQPSTQRGTTERIVRSLPVIGNILKAIDPDKPDSTRKR